MPNSSPGELSSVLWDTANPAGYGNRSGEYKTRVESEFLRRHFPPPPARILDIAGSSGRFALPLLRDGYDVTVNDINSSSLALLQKRCPDGCLQVVPGDFLRADLPGTFDAVAAMECLEYFPFEPVLTRLQEVLQPGGVFVFTAVNSGSWRFAVRRWLGRARAGEYVWKTDEYRTACARLGFDIVAMRGFNWSPFRVASNSPLVPVFAGLERTLKLDSFLSQSPWLMMAVRRKE